MKARLFQVDAFTSRPLAGNPAAVMLLEAFPKDGVLQSLAEENNLAETAFLVRDRQGYPLASSMFVARPRPLRGA
jgi:PhzF family phenazine biosynthesis protein